MSGTTDPEDPLQFAGLVAHQLRSPVSAAGSILKTLLEEYAGRLTPQQRDMLVRADRRVDQALNTVRRMLAILRPDRAEGGSSPVADVAAVLHRRCQRHAEEASSRGQALDVVTDGGSHRVAISESALSEALDAVIGNALKYTPEQGEVRVWLGLCPDDPDRVRICVGDSGIGIPEEHCEKVFEPFFRSHAARITALPGAGLGLAFVKALVDSAGGRISAGRSELGGAEFSLDLPRLSDADQPGRTAAERARTQVVIIGGVAAGPKVASKVIRMRTDVDVTVIEKGEFLSYAGCGLPYYVSGVVRDQRELMATTLGVVRDPVFFQNVKNVRVLSRTEAVEIDRESRRVRVRSLASGDESWVTYDQLVIATGASPVLPSFPWVHLAGVFTLHGVRDAEGIRGRLKDERSRDIVIVGGGLIAVEMTEALVLRGCRVTIVEQRPRILGILDPEIGRLLEQQLEAHGVRVLTSTRVTSLEGEDRVQRVVTDGGSISADTVLFAMGVRPNVDLAASAGLELGETGAIRVDERMRTSDPQIWAAGDCTEMRDLVTGRPCYFPLGSTANKQGRVAAVNLCGGDDDFPGVLASCICKVFDYCVARTGLTETDARAAGYDVESVLVPSLDREHFMPGARMMMLKLVFDTQSRRVLGAQCLGSGRSDKRIDVVATAISAGMTVDRISTLDMCYAPPYSLAMDGLITAANVAKNKLDGVLRSISPEALHERLVRKEKLLVLDVSSPREHEEERIAGSMLIPLGSLRGRVGELPRDRPIVTYCRVSLRGYEASLILQAAGFSDVRMLDGGLTMWPYDKVYGRR